MPLPDETRRVGPGQETDSQEIAATSSSHNVPDGPALSPLEFAVLRDVFLLSGPGRAQWYLRRAADFEAAKPRPGEYTGNATREQLSARWQFCDQVARAFRAKAEAVVWDEEFVSIVADYGSAA